MTTGVKVETTARLSGSGPIPASAYRQVLAVTPQKPEATIETTVDPQDGQWEIIARWPSRDS